MYFICKTQLILEILPKLIIHIELLEVRWQIQLIRKYSARQLETACINLGERSHMTSARFWQILSPPPSPLSATVSIERPPPPLMTSAFARPPPSPFQSDISFSKNPLHSTLIETLNVYLIQLKTELCRQFRGVY